LLGATLALIVRDLMAIARNSTHQNVSMHPRFEANASKRAFGD
jgi:hypothetical protein